MNWRGYITNQAYVESDEDYDIRNDRDFETTRIVAQDYDEINQVVEMCYTDTTEDTMLAAGYTQAYINKNCKKVGNFYYSNGCTATVDIIVDQNLTMPLTSVHLTKMYAPEIVNGTCATEQGICSGFQDIYIEESPSYTKGYEFDIGILAADSNITITDYNSYDGNPNNPADLAGIGLYATYTYEGVYHYGRVRDCEGISESGVVITTYADAVDTEITGSNVAVYNASTDTSNDFATPPSKLKWIQTREASGQREIAGVHLDIDTLEATPYEYQYTKDYSDFIIIPLLVNSTADNQCALESEPVFDETGAPLVIMIPEGSYSAVKTMALPNVTRRDARLQLIYIDPNTLSPEGRKCLSTSSTGGNLEGIGQCGNSEIQYVGGFGVDAWDRCGINNGSPCLSSNHGYSGGGNENYPGYNPLYDNPLGCYMCTFNLMPACSTDNFAIRPAKLDMNMTDPDGPHLLRAGKQYNVSLTARDALDDITDEYTVTDHNYNTDLGTEAVKYFSDGVRDIIGDGEDLSGSSELNASTPAYMVGGLSSLTTAGPTAGNIADEVASVYYSDVGFVGLRVYDQEWAEVDNDDTPMDCDSATHTYVCGENNVTFIPDHFDFSILNITNHGGPDNNFTYIANENNVMSAKVQTRIRALNALGTITRNFKEDSGIYKYYENNISVDLSVVVRALGNEDANDNAYRYPNANESNISNQLIGFGRSGLDVNGSGTRDILWNEPTYPLNFNFTRDQRREENPFDVNGSYLSVKVTSAYTDPEDGDSAIIEGSRIGDENTSVVCTEPFCIQSNAEGNATFMYGRTRASKFFYEDITGESVETPVAIYVYCNTNEKGYTWCDDHHVDTLFGQTSIPHWWLSTGHNTVRDGNVTLTIGNITEGAGTPKLKHDGAAEGDTLVINTQQGVDKNISVLGHTTQRPMTVEIDLLYDPSDPATIADTAPWLIYNRDHAFNLPSPFYKVRFINESGWTGVGKTGFVLETNASSTKEKRLNW